MAGGLGSWAAMLDSAFTSQGVQGLLDRTTSVQQVAQSRRSGLALAADARLHALQARLAATAATEEQQVRQAAVADAARIAKAAEAAATTQLRALAASSARVNAQLVTARAQVARLVSSRAAGLAALAAARAAARRARLAAEARAKAAAAAAASGGGSGIHHDPDTNGQAWPTGGSYTTPAQRRGAVAYARAQLGDPYVAFADGPDAFDCSGLTSAAYRSVGFVMDHYSQYQFATGRKIPVSQLQPGDLVYFATDPSNWRTIHHVGIYAGGGQMIEAPHTGDVVKYWTIWQDELVGFGTRP